MTSNNTRHTSHKIAASGHRIIQRPPSKLITALALAGMAVVGGAAFTATGIQNTDNPAQLIGGQVSQTVSGMKLSSVVYGFGADLTHQSVATVTLTFDSKLPMSLMPTIEASGGAAAQGTFTSDAGTTAGGTKWAYTYTFAPTSPNVAAGYVRFESMTVTVGGAIIIP